MFLIFSIVFAAFGSIKPDEQSDFIEIVAKQLTPKTTTLKVNNNSTSILLMDIIPT